MPPSRAWDGAALMSVRGTNPGRVPPLLALLCAAALAWPGCTEDNPIYGADQGADAVAPAGDAAGGDGGVAADAPSTDGPGAADHGAGDLSPVQDGHGCTKGAFIKCQDQHTVLRCNAAGTGTETEDCKPYLCNPKAGRCNQCDPNSKPYCSGGDLYTCSPDGLLVKTQCPQGCANGTCSGCKTSTFYKDGDGDGYGDPAVTVKACKQPSGYTSDSQDCDDADASAHPGQIGYFAVPTSGTKTYDYNCDKLEEKKDDALASCVWTALACSGDGWGASVPGCGTSGVWIECVKKPGYPPGCNKKTSSKVQSCR